MQTKIPLSKVLVYQSLGFLAIIALSWFLELTDLRKWILGEHPYISDFRESALEMVLVFGVWLLVAGSTRRLLDHARYLEGFMRVCSWCHRIDHDGHWIPQEEFFERSFDTPTTHSICPLCLAQQMEAIERKRKIPPKPGQSDIESLPPAWRQAADQGEPPSP